MATRNVNCMTNTAVVRELYWGCGGGVMSCFSGAVSATVPNRKAHPSCPREAAQRHEATKPGTVTCLIENIDDPYSRSV